jgi:hypothetical protein
MGTLSGGNGGGWPSDELPELPPEWGTIVIPDDASELTREATRVRRELRWRARELRWRRRLHLPQGNPRPHDEDIPALGVPLLVILIATIATLTSLFVIAWPTRSQRPELRPTAVTTPTVDRSAANPGNPPGPSSGPGPPVPSAAVTPRALGAAAPPTPGLVRVTLVDPGAVVPLTPRTSL